MNVSDWARCPGCDTNMVVIHPPIGPARYRAHRRGTGRYSDTTGREVLEACPGSGEPVHPADIAAAL